MKKEPHFFSDNEVKAGAAANAFSGNSAEANGIKVAGNTVNINLPKSDTSQQQNALLRFVEEVKRLRDPVKYERERQKATLIALRTEEEIVTSYRRLFPGMGEQRLFLLAHGYQMTDAQAENVFETMKAAEKIEPNPSKELPSASFTDAFVEGSSRAYDDEVRKLFAQILAGELESPGMFSRRSMAVLSEMEKEQVESFRHLCSFLFELKSVSHTYNVLAMNLDDGNCAYNEGRISWSEVSELSALGLVELDGSRSLAIEPRQSVLLEIGGKRVVVSHHAEESKKISFDPVLTKAGNELARLCEERDSEGMMHALKYRAKQNGFVLTELA